MAFYDRWPKPDVVRFPLVGALDCGLSHHNVSRTLIESRFRSGATLFPAILNVFPNRFTGHHFRLFCDKCPFRTKVICILHWFHWITYLWFPCILYSLCFCKYFVTISWNLITVHKIIGLIESIKSETRRWMYGIVSRPIILQFIYAFPLRSQR